MTKIISSALRLLANNKTAVTARNSKKYSTQKKATFEIKPCKLHKLKTGPATKSTISSAEALQLYEQLVAVRKLETAASSLYKEKVARGFCHLYTGEEAIAVGMHSVMRDVDSVITSYRCHGWTYLMKGTLICILAELSGRRTGCSKGKGGSMHVYGINFYGGNGIVGAQVPLGAGLAFAHKYRDDGGVALTLYGDGAANQGQLYEAFNMAALWHLPAVFVCENNQYGMGTSMERSSASTEYYTRGDYVPGIWVDGMDVLATREATRFALDYCSKGNGPLVMEMKTYRYHGHSMSDPGTTYRTREEVQRVRQTRDPIILFKEKIITKGLATDEELKEIDVKVKKEVDAAAKQAKRDPELPIEQLTANIYCRNLHDAIRGTNPDAMWKHLDIEPRKAS